MDEAKRSKLEIAEQLKDFTEANLLDAIRDFKNVALCLVTYGTDLESAEQCILDYYKVEETELLLNHNHELFKR
jgi:hypothetical protein